MTALRSRACQSPVLESEDVMSGASSKPRFSLGGEGGEDCDLAACKSMMDVLNRAMVSVDKPAGGKAKIIKEDASTANPQGGPPGPEAAPEVGSSTNGGSEEASSSLAAWRRQNCPLTREALGDTTWSLLHSTAAYYPDRPSDQEQVSAKGLVDGIATLYPCSHCREDFQEAIKEDPPRVESREAFAVWVCNQHNVVNEKLGKPLFKCDLASLDLRWRTGQKSCWEAPEPSGQKDK